MIPIALTLQGIYSYQEQQTIDFQQLASGQLFGIFGDVGSGKSTILEAITLALYGCSERLGKQDGFKYNLMNLRSDQLYIDFQFEAGPQRQIYRFTVQAKRQRANFDEVSPLRRKAYVWSDSGWKPLEATTAEPILGLSYQHFRRTIIIPQGKFQEFLQLKPTERTEMLQDLFNLHRFDLYGNVRALKQETDNQLHQLQGQLEGYRDVSEEQLIGAWEALHTEQLDASQLRLHFKQQDARYQQLYELKQTHQRYQEALQQFQQLEGQKPAYDQLNETLRQVRQCRTNFHDRIQRSNRLEQSIDQQRSALSQAQQTLQELQEQYRQDQEKLQNLRQRFTDQATLQQYINDLRAIMAVQEATQQLNTENQKLERAQKELEQAQQAFQERQQQWQQVRDQLQEQQGQLGDLSTLSAVQSWHVQHRSYFSKRDQAKQEKEQKQRDIDRLKAQRRELIVQYQLDKLNSAYPDYPVRDLKPALEAFREHYQVRQDQLEEEIAQVRAQQALESHAEHMEPGQPCPVCGSREHPHPLQPGDASAQVEQKQREKDRLKQWQATINQALEKLEGLKQEYRRACEEHQRQEDLLSEAQQQLEEHQQAFVWGSYRNMDEAQVNEALNQAQQQQKYIQELDEERNNKEQALEQARRQHEKANQQVQTLQQEVNRFQERITSNQEQIQRLTSADYAEMDYNELKEQEQAWLADYNQMSSLSQSLEQQMPGITQQQQHYQSVQATLDEQQRQWRAVQAELDHLLDQSEFDSLGVVQRLLDDYQDVDLSAKEDELSRFQHQYTAQHDTLKELEQELKSKGSYDPKAFDEASNAREQAEQRLREAQEQLAIRREGIQRLQGQLAFKQQLEAQHQTLQSRSNNLRTLESLFKGKGFVRYISLIFMQELCKAANERFRKLTNNQLQLEVTDEAGLQIRDLLNDGRTRSVKTLSGGQTFQVSLSLALALAERIQQLTQSSQNFFFLDEGFGSLDRNALSQVFDTLNRLRKENRIVGIISHVEELKEGLETSLSVENDHERGSLIHYQY
jgi:exonuclease SbcC